MCIFGFLTSSWGPLSWQCPLCHTFIPHWDCRFSIILLPPPCDTSEGRVPSQERCCARQNRSEVHHFSAEQPESILFSLSPCPADSYGNIEPDLEPVWALAVAGSSSIMWEKSTETLGYFLAQVKTVKQWVSGAAESTALRGGYSQIPGGFSSPAAPPLHQHFVQVLLGKLSLPGSAGVASAGAAVLSPAAEPSTSAPGHAHTWHKHLAGEQLQHLQHIQQHFLSPPGPQPAGIHRQDPGFAPQLFSMRFL